MDIVEYANYIEEGLTNEEIAERYGYTNEEMKEVLERIGIIFDGDEADRYKENIYCRWTKEDEEYLIKNHKRMNNEELGVALGRSYSSIDQRKRDLGLSTTQQHHRRWTTEEDDYLEKNYKSIDRALYYDILSSVQRLGGSTEDLPDPFGDFNQAGGPGLFAF